MPHVPFTTSPTTPLHTCSCLTSLYSFEKLISPITYREQTPSCAHHTFGHTNKPQTQHYPHKVYSYVRRLSLFTLWNCQPFRRCAENEFQRSAASEQWTNGLWTTPILFSSPPEPQFLTQINLHRFNDDRLQDLFHSLYQRIKHLKSACTCVSNEYVCVLLSFSECTMCCIT